MQKEEPESAYFYGEKPTAIMNNDIFLLLFLIGGHLVNRTLAFY